MARRRVRGDRSFLRLLKQLSPSIREEVNLRLNKLGDVLLAEQRSSGRFLNYVGRGKGAPGLRAALSKRVTPKTMKLKVGLVGKALNRKLFYGHFIEYGRKAGGRGIKRGSAKYNMGVGRTQPDHFIRTKGTSSVIGKAYNEFRGFWNSVLAKAARGAGDD